MTLCATIASCLANAPGERPTKATLQQLAGRNGLSPWETVTEPVDSLLARWRWIEAHYPESVVRFLGSIFESDGLGMTGPAKQAYGKLMSWMAMVVSDEGIPTWADVKRLADFETAAIKHYSWEDPEDYRLVDDEPEDPAEQVHELLMGVISNPEGFYTLRWGRTNNWEEDYGAPLWYKSLISRMEDGETPPFGIEPGFCKRLDIDLESSHYPCTSAALTMSDGTEVEIEMSYPNFDEVPVERGMMIVSWDGHGDQNKAIRHLEAGIWRRLELEESGPSTHSGSLHSSLESVIQRYNKIPDDRARRGSTREYDRSVASDLHRLLDACRWLMAVAGMQSRVLYPLVHTLMYTLTDWIVENPRRFSELASQRSMRVMLDGITEDLERDTIEHRQAFKDRLLAQQRLDGEAYDERRRIESTEDTLLRATFSDGASIVELLTPRALSFEGDAMHHCIGTEGHGYPQMIRDGRMRAFSYRNPEGKPQATWAVKGEDMMETLDLQGPWNRKIRDPDAKRRLPIFMHRMRQRHGGFEEPHWWNFSGRDGYTLGLADGLGQDLNRTKLMNLFIAYLRDLTDEFLGGEEPESEWPDPGSLDSSQDHDDE